MTGPRETAGAGLVAVHHVQLAAPAGAEPGLRAFYGGVLGMTEVPKPAALTRRGGVWFRSGNVELHLGIEADFRPARKAHPGLLAPSVHAALSDATPAETQGPILLAAGLAVDIVYKEAA